MKTALFAFIGLLSLNAFATNLESYNVGAPYVVPTQPGVSPGDVVNCPSVSGIQLFIKDASLDAVGGTAQINGMSVFLVSTGASQTCLSDVVCPTSDTFATQPASNIAFSLTRNNDGQYPTTDLPGHSDLVIYGQLGGKALSCYYPITVAPGG